jgi:hypothetical protein
MISDEIKNQLVAQDRGTGDLGEVATFDPLNEVCSWLPKDTDAARYGDSTVIDCKLISSSNDPYVIFASSPTQVTFSGEYSLSTFDQISYKFKDIETNEIIQAKGWPPTDPRAKYMFELTQDPRHNIDVKTVVEFIIEFDFSNLLVSSSSPNPTVAELGIITDDNLYVDEENRKAYRKDRIEFIQTVRNYSYKKLCDAMNMCFCDKSYK